MKCDFCSNPDVKWDFPCRDFTRNIGVIGKTNTTYASDEGWLTCQECHDLILAGDEEGLVNASMLSPYGEFSATVGKLAPSEQAQVRAGVRRLHNSFRANRIGPPVPYEEDK